MNKFIVVFKNNELVITNGYISTHPCKVYDPDNLPRAISALWKQLKFDLNDKNIELELS